MKKQDIQSSQQGTGSSENRNDIRDAQKNQTAYPDNNQEQDLAHQAGLGRERMSSIEEMGGLSGRDDYAGGDNDGVSDQNTNERTNR